MLEYAPLELAETAEWIAALPLDQAITVGIAAIIEGCTRPHSLSQLAAAMYALEARWAEAGAMLRARQWPVDPKQSEIPLSV